jgi:hypothetical protein
MGVLEVDLTGKFLQFHLALELIQIRIDDQIVRIK